MSEPQRAQHISLGCVPRELYLSFFEDKYLLHAEVIKDTIFIHRTKRTKTIAISFFKKHN